MTAVYVPRYAPKAHGAHLVEDGRQDGDALCGSRLKPGRVWLGTATEDQRARLARFAVCIRCVRQRCVLEAISSQAGSQPLSAGVLGVVRLTGKRLYKIALCADCERPKPIAYRGLCGSCADRHFKDGTIADYGWTRADRLAEYSGLLRQGLTPGEAAERMGICRETAYKYGRALRQEQRAAA